MRHDSSDYVCEYVRVKIDIVVILLAKDEDIILDTVMAKIQATFHQFYS